MSNVTEVWRPVNGYEGLYSVSSLGRVRSEKRLTGSWQAQRILSPVSDNKGYAIVQCFRSGKRKNLKVHRLVAVAFLPNPQCLPQVNHINGEKGDNRAFNLEWTDSEGNMQHALKTLKLKYGPDYHVKGKSQKGATNGNCKLDEKAVISIRQLLANGVSGTRLAKVFNISLTQIYRIKNRQKWTHL